MSGAIANTGTDDFEVFGKVMSIFYYHLEAMDFNGENINLHSPDFNVDYEVTL